jgi:prepilin-type N-terminal cleavage/methylation domain-containing protein
MYKKGFTLIELIVASVILSFVALALGAAFMSGMRIMERAKQVGFTHTDILLNLEMVDKELSQCLKDYRIGLEGTDEELSFGYLKGTSIVKVSYVFEKGDLLRRESDLEDILDEEEGLSDEGEYRQKKILSLDDLEWSYFYFNEQKMEYEWVDEWDKEDQAPLAVKLEIEVNDEDFVRTIFIL